MAKTTGERLTRLIVEQLGIDAEEVTPEATFLDDLGCDSLDTIELVMACEEEFGIEIPDGEAEPLVSVQLAVAYLDRRIAGRA